MGKLRQMFHDIYETILGRNTYNQNLRAYCYTPYKDGKYYSDCSSSGCKTFEKLGIEGVSSLNTAGMHNSSKKKVVDVRIEKGHIIPEDIGKLKVGMALMFKGNDPSRPLQIGHVEYIYEVNGPTESDIVICGHGSNTPSTKNLKTYCQSRYSQKASNGVRKELVEVLDFLCEDSEDAPVEGTDITAELTVTTSSLYVRKAPVNGASIGTVRMNQKVRCTKYQNIKGKYWLYSPDAGGWMSSAYLKGKILQDAGEWYLKGDGTYAVNEVINDEVYDRNGWRVTPERFKNGIITY